MDRQRAGEQDERLSAEAVARTVFLTGATGFIGARLARALVKRGDHLRCLVRRPRAATALEALGAELIPGEVTDEIAVARGLAGTDLAYHLAARYDIGMVDRDAMVRVNVEGTRTFLRELERAGTARGVYTSTTGALGPVSAGEGGADAHWSTPYPSLYHETKTRAHELARAAQNRGVPLVVVCPGLVYGPGDHGPAGRLVADLVRGKLPALIRPPAWFTFEHVDDVVVALVRAGLRGAPGDCYVLAGEAASLEDFALQVAALAGRRPPPLRLPARWLIPVAAMLDGLTKLTGRRFLISREAVATNAGWRWLHRDERAVQDLGWDPRPLAEGLPETVSWFRSQV